MARINDEESFLIQAHALVECLVKLGKLEANKESFCIDNIDKIYGQTAKLMAEKGRSVFQGQGVLMGVFYMFLVLPLEWKKKNVGDFRKLDLSEAENIANEDAEVKKDTYPKNDKALHHFRNALAHARVGWENGNLVIRDKNPKTGSEYCAEFSRKSLEELAQSLNKGIANYIKNVIKSRS